MRGILVFCAAYFACFAVVAIADTVDKDVNAMVKALSFSDLNSLKQVWYSDVRHDQRFCANIHFQIARDADIDFKQRLDSEDRAWMHIVAM